MESCSKHFVEKGFGNRPNAGSILFTLSRVFRTKPSNRLCVQNDFLLGTETASEKKFFSTLQYEYDIPKTGELAVSKLPYILSFRVALREDHFKHLMCDSWKRVGSLRTR